MIRYEAKGTGSATTEKAAEINVADTTQALLDQGYINCKIADPNGKWGAEAETLDRRIAVRRFGFSSPSGEKWEHADLIRFHVRADAALAPAALRALKKIKTDHAALVDYEETNTEVVFKAPVPAPPSTKTTVFKRPSGPPMAADAPETVTPARSSIKRRPAAAPVAAAAKRKSRR